MADLPKRPKFVTVDVDRHDNERIYARHGGRKVRLRGPLFSAAFWEDYGKWRDGALRPHTGPRIKPALEGTLRWACEQYYSSTDYLSGAPRTRYVKRLRLDNICARPAASGPGVFGDAPFRHIEARHLRKLLDAKAAKPHGANNDLKALKALFKFAVKRDMARVNPCVDIAATQPGSAGFHTWTPAEREAFRAKHPIGTKPRLALEIFLLTGVRRSDLVKIGRPHLRQTAEGEAITFTVTKGSHSKRRTLTLPVLPALRMILDASQDLLGDLTFVTTAFGRPYSVNGFGAWFKRQCVAAGLPHCSAHGVRKLAATTMADNGATVHQLMAAFGWSKASQAEIYTVAADQQRLARDGFTLMSAEQPGHKSVPLSGAVKPSGTISTVKPLKAKEA